MNQEVPDVHGEAASILEDLTGADVRPYINTDFGRQKQLDGVSVVVPQQRAELLVRELQGRLPDSHAGYIGTTRWLGDEDHDGVELAAGVGDEHNTPPIRARD